MKRLIPFVLTAAMATPFIPLVSGCDREVAKDKTETRDANGNLKTSQETSVKEKSDGTIVKEHTEKDNTSNH